MMKLDGAWGRAFRGWSLMMALCLLAGCGVGVQEDVFRRRLQEMDEMLSGAAPDLGGQISAKRAELERAYKALPSGKARGDPLGKLNQESYAFIEQMKAKSKQAAALRAAEQLKSMVGYWRGVGMDLTITEAGSVGYEGIEDGVKKSVAGKIKELKADAFTVGVLVGTAKFRIDELPHESGGAWKMRIDGIEIERQHVGTKPR